MNELKEVIEMLEVLKEQSLKSCKDTAVLDVNIDSFNFAIDKAIELLKREPDTLNKIRYEIEEHAKINQNLNTDRARALCWCLDVIDKYRTESDEEACKVCRYNDGEPHAECVVCDK